jgi:phosphatidylserine decarboxylase
MKLKNQTQQEVNTKRSIENGQVKMNPDSHYPFNMRSGWLPKPGSSSMQAYFDMIINDEHKEWAKCIKDMNDYIESNEVIKYLVDNACKENINLIESHLVSPNGVDGVPIPRIKDKEKLLDAFNKILTHAPSFINNELVGLPFSALVVAIDPTLSGSVLFRLPMFNEKMGAILNEWNKFLASKASNHGFSIEGKQWLSDAAKIHYDFPIWKKDSETLPYWDSWNSFFTRKFKDPSVARPIADPSSNQTVICPNDGSLFSWEANISKKDVFWFKDMKYSLSDILSSSVKEQQDLIDKHKLVDMFSGGYIFQTYLNPYNFHCWWSPVNAEVLFDPFVIPGCFFSKLIIPDFGGATTESLPYLAQVNARGVIVFKTKDYGHVCCIPLGMSEVSSIEFDKKMKKGAKVTKGQEMGNFNYGGSSFVIIYENLPGKKLVFQNSLGTPYPANPPQATSSAGTGVDVTNIGAQIGVWESADPLLSQGSPFGVVYNKQLHNLFFDVNGNISDVWNDGLKQKYQNLNELVSSIPNLNVPGSSTAAPAPSAQGNPFSIVYKKQLHNLYWDVNGNISDIWYDVKNKKTDIEWYEGKNWYYQNLNSLPFVAPLANGNPFAVVYNEQLHNLYMDVNNQISDIWFDGKNWNYQNLNLCASAAPLALGNPSAVIYNNQMHNLYLDINGNISDIWFDGSKWHYQNLNKLAPKATLTQSSPFSMVYKKQLHNLYLDFNNQISDIWYDGSKWLYQNLNSLVPSAPLAYGNPFAVEYFGQLHNLYLDANNQISDIWFDGSTWQYQNLNLLDSSAPLAQGNIFAVVYEGQLHNLYTDINNQVSDIWYDGSKWHYRNLSPLIS